MKILLTGATGYIGRRLLPVLIQQGHEVICSVRDKSRFIMTPSLEGKVSVIEIDFLNSETVSNIPADMDAAYYLIHSMSADGNFGEKELMAAENFRKAVTNTGIRQVIYLSGIVNEESLSEHLSSRRNVEMELAKGTYHLTTLRAGIIIGSGSASFEIIRDLVEKLPVMITPKWLKTRCQPIGISDVIKFLSATLFEEKTFDQNFDIGGPDILTYREMLLTFAEIRGLKRIIRTVPVMTPKISSYWLYFITSTSYRLAIALVDSMKVEVVCRNNDLNKILDIYPVNYREALQQAFMKVESNDVISSWKDAFVSGRLELNLSEFLNVPTFGCLTDKREVPVHNEQLVLEKMWKIGGDTGWYYANWLWKIRGLMDKIAGGVGLRRGRTSETALHPGDAVDFWRVLFADKKEKRLLLYAEMKLPGEAWLEFRIRDGKLRQTATFRPKGLMGRLYWYGIYPVHIMVFKGMIRNLAKTRMDQ